MHNINSKYVLRKMILKELKFRQATGTGFEMLIKVLEHPRKYPDFMNNTRQMIIDEELRYKQMKINIDSIPKDIKEKVKRYLKSI